MSNDVSPYLQRPVRKLEEVIAEVQQQRLDMSRTVPVAAEPKPPASPPAAGSRA